MMIAQIAQSEFVPNIVQLQRWLVQLGKFRDSDVFSRKWMDPILTSDVLSKMSHLFLKKKDLVVRTFSERVPRSHANRKRFVQNLISHFTKTKRPVMLDDDTYAYIITGIRIDRVSELVELLVFDPHVHVVRTSSSTLVNGLTLKNFQRFESTSPLRPQGTARWIPLNNILFLRDGAQSKKLVWMSCFFAVGEDENLSHLLECE